MMGFRQFWGRMGDGMGVSCDDGWMEELQPED